MWFFNTAMFTTQSTGNGVPIAPIFKYGDDLGGWCVYGIVG